MDTQVNCIFAQNTKDKLNQTKYMHTLKSRRKGMECEKARRQVFMASPRRNVIYWIPECDSEQ